ncbi:MAG: hypothetical protein MJ252_23595, partial [archaeon]|nr:hypothetical protein [archaeon]
NKEMNIKLSFYKKEEKEDVIFFNNGQYKLDIGFNINPIIISPLSSTNIELIIKLSQLSQSVNNPNKTILRKILIITIIDTNIEYKIYLEGILI